MPELVEECEGIHPAPPHSHSQVLQCDELPSGLLYRREPVHQGQHTSELLTQAQSVLHMPFGTDLHSQYV